jgi:hypothetical protein
MLIDARDGQIYGAGSPGVLVVFGDLFFNTLSVFAR